jgi:hypothetical protein
VTAKGARRLSIVAAAGAAVTIACALFAHRAKIMEEYWLWRLRHSDEDWGKAAIRELGERRSVKGVRGILELMPKYPGLSSHALVKIGKPAVPAIFEALQRPNCSHKLELIFVTERINPIRGCAFGVHVPVPLPPEE